jgi:uncharacterized membrane protein YgcG
MILRRRIRRSGAADSAGWDGDAQDPLILLLHETAQADDLAPGDPRATATRSAVLSAFGHATWPAAAKTGTRRQPRRTLALALAGLVTLGAVGAVAASAPGGVLYDARITLEEALLPPGQAGRGQAQVERLAARVAEVEHALRAGDASAAAASLAAFTRIATAAADDREAGPVEVEMAARVRAQLAALARLQLPEPGLAVARDNAAAAARRLLGALEQRAPDASPGPPGPGPSPSPGTDDAGSPAPAGPPGDGSGSGPGSPSQTARPGQATPRPDGSTAAPEAPGSSGTPRPGASPGSGPGSSGEPGSGGSSTPGSGGSGSGGGGGGGAGGRP